MNIIKGLTLGTVVSGVLLSGVVSDTNQADAATHVVKPGETLFTIAKQHNTTVDDLLKSNTIVDKNKIKVGQKLEYGVGDKTRVVYTVKSGDTLYKIGKKYGVSYQSIMAKNGLTSTLIHVGDKLVVKGKPFNYVLNKQVQNNNTNTVATTQYTAPTTVAQPQVTQAPTPKTVNNQQQVAQNYVAKQQYKAPVRQTQPSVQTYQAPKQTQTTNALNTGGNSSVDAHLRQIMQRESGGNPRAVNPAGYYGLFQFSPQTWAAVGGQGNPANASVEEQWKRARILYTQYGAQHWSTAY